MIKNKTKNKILAKKVYFCKGILSKSIGLMFSKKKSLVFVNEKEKLVPLHMCFVFYPIDVLFLDKEKKVIEIKKNFKPFTFFNPKHKAKYVIELPYGFKGSKVGDKIEF